MSAAGVLGELGDALGLVTSCHPIPAAPRLAHLTPGAIGWFFSFAQNQLWKG